MYVCMYIYIITITIDHKHAKTATYSVSYLSTIHALCLFVILFI